MSSNALKFTNVTGLNIGGTANHPMTNAVGISMEWQQTGLCSFCMKPLESLQPGGLTPRHAGSEILYGACPEAIKQKDPFA